jgi:transcriptional antiterminator RfaH
MVDWYILHSKPNKEEFVLHQLNLRDINAYYPCVKAEPVNPRSRKIKPYFPGYLFINANIDLVATSTLKWIPGSVGLVSFGNEPASLPDDTLQTIRNHIEQLNKASGNTEEEFVPGEPVQIQSGPFSGYQAIFDSYTTGHERVQVLLQMLHDRKIKVDLAKVTVEHVSRCQSND